MLSGSARPRPVFLVVSLVVPDGGLKGAGTGERRLRLRS